MSKEIIGWAVGCWIAGFLVTFILTPVIRNFSFRRRLLDRVGRFHSSHTLEVPRFGGVALAASFLVLVGVLCAGQAFNVLHLPDELGLMVFTSLAAFGLGFWDDIKPVRAKTKLVIQIGIASIVYAGGLRIDQWMNPFTQTVYHFGGWGYVLTVIWLVSITNLINLVDGIDGLAAGLILMIMIVFAVVGGLGIVDNPVASLFPMLLALGLAGSLSAFLFYNFPPARIFMGDGGAYFKGMLIAEMSLLNANKGEVAAALIVPFFALGLPIIDSSFTIFRRYMVGLPIFRADRKHIHHRLAAMGLSQRRVVLTLYALCVFFALLALIGFITKGRLIPVLFGIFMFVMVMSARAFGFVRNWYKVGRLLTDSIARRKHTRYALLLGQLLLFDAETSETLDDLWKHYGFVLAKLRFSSAVFNHGDREFRWDTPHAKSGAEICVVQDVKGVSQSEITFCCSTSTWDDDTFRLLAELMAEAWSKAATRFEELHR
jgi:UDP-GlcNAc:undecaprenyl-phosphate/decaprenyl-phosphate GlcNAc-1-phosphate transferase